MCRKIIAALLCVCLFACLAACGDHASPETKSAQTASTQANEESTVSEAGTESAEKPFGKFTMEQLCEQNRVSVLLKEYKTVSFLQNNLNGQRIKEGCYFSFRNYPVSAERQTYGEEEYYFSFNGNDVFFEDNRYSMRALCGFNEEAEMRYDLDLDIVMKFDTGLRCIYDVKETADSYTFSIGESEDEKEYSDILCKVSKYDLSIREITLNYGTKSETVTVFRYNEPVRDYGFSDGWSEHKLREVTIIQEISVDGEIADGFSTVAAPYNVEVLPFSYQDHVLWADGEWTQKYEYPGDDCDYTVYFTNIMG